MVKKHWLEALMNRRVKLIVAGMVMILVFVFSASGALASNTVRLYFFWGEGCPHCAAEKEYLKELTQEYPSLEVIEYEVWYDKQNQKLLGQVGKALGEKIGGVPVTIIGESSFTGFSSGYSELLIKVQVKKCVENTCKDIVAELNQQGGVDQGKEKAVDGKTEAILPSFVSLPVVGEIATANLSLPVFAILLGAADGFNPCAMWVLVFLISLLMGVEDKKRRWLLGLLFIGASAAVYLVFMASWLNLILFIGVIGWMRVLIGLVALAGGGFHLREFVSNRDQSCKVTGSGQKKAITERLTKAVSQKNIWLAGIGLVVLAFMVNLVELVCSAGLPVVFTQVLAMSNLDSWQYALYMLMYVFVFMLDDLLVFMVAMVSLELTGLSTRFTRLSQLVGGMVLVVVGFLLIFRPELLMFG